MSEPPASDPPPADPVPERPSPAPAPPQPPGRRPSPSAESSSTDTARLLVRALAQLAPDERDQVYTWLLSSSLPELGPPSQLTRQLSWAMRAEAPSARRQQFAEAGVEIVRDLVRSPSGSAQQMVPVRFSAEQHARLRAWCTEHGFSMATVIRGLVDRFLESQHPEAT
jgi:ParG